MTTLKWPVQNIWKRFLKNISIKDELIFEKFYKLHNAVSAPVTATQDALAERLQGVRETAFLLYNRMMENMGYGRERLKDIPEKEAEEEQQQEEEKVPAAAKEQQQDEDE